MDFSRWPLTDDIHARAPVDRVAVRVTSRGVSFNPQKRVLTGDSSTPIPTRPILACMRSQPNFQDLTAVRFGRFRVIGLAAQKLGHWVVRCDCGTYSTRASKAIKNPANHVDRCEHCRHLAFLQASERYRRLGRRADAIRDES